MTLLVLEQQMDEVEEVGRFRFYTERDTNLIYEVQLFERYVLARPATPGFEAVIRKMMYKEFVKDFDEYEGNPDEVRTYISDGDTGNGLVATRRR